MTVRRYGFRVGRLTAALVALVLVAVGCGSGPSKTVTKYEDPGAPSSATVFPVLQMQAVSGAERSRMRIAVGDESHAMLLTYQSGVGDAPRDKISASVVSPIGGTAPVDLPDLQWPNLVPWSGGYAVGGVHCERVDSQGEETICDHGVPVVTFLAATGAVKAMVAIPGVTDVRPELVRFSAGGDEVIVRTAENTYFTVTTDGVKKLPALPGQGHDVCRLRDDTVIAATSSSPSTDPTDTETSAGKMQIWTLTDGKWTGPTHTIKFGKYGNPSTNCVSGGLVTTLGIITHRGDFDTPTPVPSGVASATVATTVAWASGFDSSGRLYLSVPPSMDAPVQATSGNTNSVAIDPDDRWVGVSANGRFVALGSSPVDFRIVNVG